jgi:hypothetical protein
MTPCPTCAASDATEACRLAAIACYRSPSLATKQRYETTLNALCNAWIAEYEHEQDHLAAEGVDSGE